MEPNPYEPPVAQGYRPPRAPILSVKQAGLLMAIAYGAIVLAGFVVMALVPAAWIQTSWWLLATAQAIGCCLLFALLSLGQSTGWIERPQKRPATRADLVAIAVLLVGLGAMLVMLVTLATSTS
jgi:hypothetical protein